LAGIWQALAENSLLRSFSVLTPGIRVDLPVPLKAAAADQDDEE
jgi:hypothetical protein